MSVRGEGGTAQTHSLSEFAAQRRSRVEDGLETGETASCQIDRLGASRSLRGREGWICGNMGKNWLTGRVVALNSWATLSWGGGADKQRPWSERRQQLARSLLFVQLSE